MLCRSIEVDSGDKAVSESWNPTGFPGYYFGNIGYFINRYATAQGFSVVYEFCGHGVGIDFHEDPQVDHSARKNSGPKMKPGMIFTIEPMINEGKPRVKSRSAGWLDRPHGG